jgi:hypothetical protein
VLVLETGILLMHTDNVLKVDGSTLCISAVTIEILNVTETVATQGKLVSRNSEADISDVKGLLAVVGSAGVCGAKVRSLKIWGV